MAIKPGGFFRRRKPSPGKVFPEQAAEVIQG